MLILYYKIYEAAKKVIEAEHKSQCTNIGQIKAKKNTNANNQAYASSYKQIKQINNLTIKK